MHPSLGERSGAWLAGLVSAVCALSLLAALVGAGPAAAQAADPPECLYPGADAFGGTSLDLAERWTSTLRHDASAYTVADGKVKIQTGAGEIQSTDQAGGAPNIFLQPAPEGTWEITTKVKIDHTTEGQQAGLLLTDPTGLNLVKLAFVQKGPNDNNNRWIEFLKIVGGAVRLQRHVALRAALGLPGRAVAALPQRRHDAVGLLLDRRRDLAARGRPALLRGDRPTRRSASTPCAAAPTSPVVTAEFDSFDLVPANDEFDGTAVDECRWTEIQNRNDAGMSVGDGELTLRTLQGELSNDESTVQNMLLQRTNDSDWQATTKVTMTPTTEGQQAGLVIWGDNTDPERSNNVKLVFVRKNGNATNNAWIEFLKTTDGVTDLDFNNQSRWNSGLGDYGPEVHLRLVSAGGQLAAYWSDGRHDLDEGGRHPPDHRHREPAGRADGAQGPRCRQAGGRREVRLLPDRAERDRARAAGPGLHHAGRARDRLHEDLRRHPGLLRPVGARRPGLLHAQRGRLDDERQRRRGARTTACTGSRPSSTRTSRSGCSGRARR